MANIFLANGGRANENLLGLSQDITFSGNIAVFVQEVFLYSVFDGSTTSDVGGANVYMANAGMANGTANSVGSNFNIAVFIQEVYSERLAHNIAVFAQDIYDGSIPSHYDRRGWDVEVQIGDELITTANIAKENGFTELLTITATENQARVLTFKIFPPEGPQNPEYYQGKPVIVRAIDSTGIKETMFTGFVDVPKLDINKRTIAFTCTDRRANQIIQLDPGVVDSIGYYSEDVFGKVKDQAEELDNRMKTIPYSFDFDNAGNWTLTPWAPKTTADYVLSTNPGELYYSNPEVEYTNRTKTVNTINITVNYTYQRLHQQVCSVTWEGYDNFCSDWFNAGKPTFPTRDSITSAAQSGNWVVMTRPTINFTAVWPAMLTNCGTPVVWQPNDVKEEYGPRTVFAGYIRNINNTDFIKDDNGQYVPMYTVQVDADGDPILDVIRRTITDTSSQLCRAANWQASLHFAQTITETYNMTLTAPQSIAVNEVIEGQDQVDIEDKFDTNEWESSKTTTSYNNNFYIDKVLNRSKANAAIFTILHKNYTELLKQHRDVIVRFSRPLLAALDLKHTIEIDYLSQVPGWTKGLQCKGKVGSITHTFDFSKTKLATTSVELWLSRAQGEASQSDFIVSQPTQDPSYIGEVIDVPLGTHLGEDPDPTVTFGAETWNGYIGNKEITVLANTYRTQFSEAFVVDYPPISEDLRAVKVYESDAEFTISIPNDDLIPHF